MSCVSVVIVNYNAGNMLKDSVTSVMYSKSVTKVIIVDNGSSDHSTDEIERLVDSRSRLLCIRNNEN